MLRMIARSKFSPGLNCLEDVSLGKRDFFMEVGQDLLSLFKKFKN
jgi:hypothetical protein